MVDYLSEIHIAELEEFGLPLEVINKLEKKGIMSLRNLLYTKPRKLDTMRQVGPKRRRLIIQAVVAHRDKYKW